MLRALSCILLVLALPIVRADPPFWKSKEKAYGRIKNGEILVAVARDKSERPGPKHLLKINGGGHVGAPRAFVFARAQDFAALPKVSGYVRTAKYDAAAQTLDLELSAYGYDARMQILVDVIQTGERRRIQYRVLSGALRGLTGHFSFEELSQKTEVGMEGEFVYDVLPIPTLFVEFGLEVVFQRMALSLRSYVESEFRKMRKVSL